MADVIRKTTNRFSKGLVMDFSPENTRNEVLTHALNATLLTFNGNELSLQNDMGNARIETAYLPEGYMPVGTCEYGGIIYIVSYNPLDDRCQIGCFPSPERNISSKELGEQDVIIKKDAFQTYSNDIPTGDIIQNTQCVLLRNDNLNPGDKFLICADDSIYDEKLQNLLTAKEGQDFKAVDHPILALNVVSIEESGKINYLNSDIRYYDFKKEDIYYRYHILGSATEDNTTFNQADVDPDSVRSIISSGYSVFKSKTSGRLAILAELIMIDSYSVTHRLLPREGAFDVVISTEITPELSLENYMSTPKLKFYFLENSQGYIQNQESSVELFIGSNRNSAFNAIKLSDLYNPTVDSLNLEGTLGETGVFDFPRKGTYHADISLYTSEELPKNTESLYTKFNQGSFYRIIKDQVLNNIGYYNSINAKFYKYDPEGSEITTYTDTTLNENYVYYKQEEEDNYIDAERNSQNKNKELWKLTSVPVLATDKEKKDITIEKWQYEPVERYVVATDEEVTKGIDLWIKKEDNTYVGATGIIDSNTTYYIKKTEENFISIGTGNFESVTEPLYYYTESKSYSKATEEELSIYWDTTTYPITNKENLWGAPFILYYIDKKTEYIPITIEEASQQLQSNTTIYYSTKYVWISDLKNYSADPSESQLFITVPEEVYTSYSRFAVNEQYNYIEGVNTPSEISRPAGDPEVYPNESPVHLYIISEFIPSNEEGKRNYLNYDDVTLASIKIPEVVSNNGLDLPFKYDYTIVPCMNYGKLSHLAVSNTIDFSKLHDFNLSNFTTWKYRIDGDQLRLTFGAEIYDTYETDKIDGLFLEFYDCWGFAGSLEIADRKSYSGIFTKTIPLNTLKAINNKKHGEAIGYSHNINILPSDNNTFKLGDKTVTYEEMRGWKMSEKYLAEYSDNEYDDCGTLYSNIVYAVKTYLRRTVQGTQEFIEKDTFFLYTLPIYNDFYYQLDNFNSIENPELDLVLTYKLVDSSSKIAYSNDDSIIDGYSTITPDTGMSDSTIVTQYLSGNYSGDTEFTITKYYKYTGTSQLYLEVGLHKDYESYNISYDEKVNEKFNCTLKLLSEGEDVFEVKSDDELVTDTILNYTDDSLNKINKLGFGNDKTDTIELTNIKSSNFITSAGTNPILITYDFVVGYKATISDIRETQVPATTVCALCHKNINGEYNYEDFGVYHSDVGFLSSIMFYNEGDSTTEIFGICRQVNFDGTVSEQCQSTTSVTTEAQKITTPGKLNSGDPLKSLSSNLGKLTFCTPHVHGLQEMYGINVYHSDNDSDKISKIDDPRYYGISSRGRQHGVVPSALFRTQPKYNSVLNTQNSIKYNAEFISTLDYATKTGREFEQPMGTSGETQMQMRCFSGFTGKQLATFNEKLVNTMQSIYAYNPDYDQLTVNVGNVSLQQHNPSFVTNLLSTKAAFIGDFNDYIKLGPIVFSDYLTYLQKYSNIEIKNDTTDSRVQFKPTLTYCGDGEKYYLLTPLTYSTPVPKELEEELEFTSSDSTVIKTSDGNNTIVKGTPDKKALYGKKGNQLVELDVTNYRINSDGTLAISDKIITDVKDYQLPISSNVITSLADNELYEFTNTFNEETLNMSLSFKDTKNLVKTRYYSDNEQHYVIALYTYDKTSQLEFYPEITPATKNYSAVINNFAVGYSYAVLQGTNINNINNLTIRYDSLDITTLNKLVDPYADQAEVITVPSEDGEVVTKSIDEFKVRTDQNEYVNANIQFVINSSGNMVADFEVQGHYSQSCTLIVRIKLTDISYAVAANIALEDSNDSFIASYRTSNYSKLAAGRYTAKKYPAVCIRGSWITINDLIYEPNQEGHRLFVRNNLCNYDPSLRGEIYYRITDGTTASENYDWSASTRDFNTLKIFTGPCFTTYNL